MLKSCYSGWLFGHEQMRKLEAATLFLLAALFMLWPIPHTISVRDVLVVILFGLVSYLAYKNVHDRVAGLIYPLRIPIGIYCAFTVWIFVVAIFISDDMRWSLDEIRGQWLKPAIVAAVGGLLPLALLSTLWRRWAYLTILAALLVHVLYVDWLGLEALYKTGTAQIRMSGLTEGPDKSSYLANQLVVLLLAEVVFRATVGRRFLPVSIPILSLFMLIALGGVFFTWSRNGLMEVVFAFVLATVVFLSMNRSRLHRPVTAAVAILLILVPVVQGSLSYEADWRWRAVVETIPLALDTDTHKAWLDDRKYPLPKLRDGAAVEISTYYRVAWIKEGAILAFENPLGSGFGRNVFGHARMQKYGEGGTGYSHSGVVDLAIGAGIPGVILWIAFLVSLFRMAYGGLMTSPSYHALLLLLVIGSFGFRMLIDSVMRDHMFQTFMFMIGMLATTMALERSAQRKRATVTDPIGRHKAQYP